MERGGSFEPEYQHDDAAALLEQLQANSQALIVATVGFLQERGIETEAWARSLGEQFAKDWPDEEAFRADEFLDAMLTNLRGFGASVVSADFSPDEASATIAGFPSVEVCDLYGVEMASVAGFHEAARVIAQSQRLSWDWNLDGDETRIVVKAVDR